MHRILIVALALVAAASPAAAAERRYTVTDFDRIRVDGPYRVVLTTGKPSAARASGSHAALDRLSVDVQGKTLRIRANQSAWGASADASQGPVTIEISTASLRYAGVNGAGTLAIDRAKSMRLDLSLAGSGRIEAPAIETDTLYLSLLGSGQIRVGGSTKTVRAEVHGSGDIVAADLAAMDAEIIADTAGAIRMEAVRSAKVTSTATGDVEVTGEAACIVKALGTGRIRCGS